ncbi:MAG: pilus assembly protein CpaE [Chloroflexota bacterium]|jgi:pilus assembly protein CpaE|nr:pilus assembly protein CpaE [Chloroflexota bacterium]
MVEADPGPGRVVAVYSGKGGVGRTTLCVNLASVLATDHHRRVVALDMDLQYGDLASMIPSPEEHPSLGDLVAAPVDDLDADFVATGMIEGPGGFKVIACPPRPELSELVTAAHVTQILTILKQRFEIVLVDCGAHLADPTAAVMDMADTVLLLTSATTPALKSLRLAMELLRRLGMAESKMQVVLNHPDDHADFSDEEVAANLSHHLAGSLPHDSKTAVVAIDSGEPFVYTRPRSGLAAGVRRLAASIDRDSGAPADDRRGLMGILTR